LNHDVKHDWQYINFAWDIRTGSVFSASDEGRNAREAVTRSGPDSTARGLPVADWKAISPTIELKAFSGKLPTAPEQLE
jgi:hypothetical protein